MKYFLLFIPLCLAFVPAPRPATATRPVSVEDTVRLQIGGELFYLDGLDPSDSITVIGTDYFLPAQGELYRAYRFIDHNFHFLPAQGELYRAYRFIDHNFHSAAHRRFSEAVRDSVYRSYLTEELYEDYRNDYYLGVLRRLDSIRVQQIDPVIRDFTGYWIYLTEYRGDYYLDDQWAWCGSFRIADTVYTDHYMDGPWSRKILKAIEVPGGISLLREGDEEPFEMRVVDPRRSVYSLGGESYVAPARAIHNFQIIQYCNTTGDLM